MLQDFPLARIVLSAAQLAFFVHGLSLLLHAAFSQQGLNEEIGESLHSLQELCICDFEVVVGLFVGGPGVVHA